MSHPLRNKRSWKPVLAMALVLLPCAALPSRTDSSQDVKEAKPNPKELAQWVDAGFKFGWMSVKDAGTMSFDEKQPADGLPSFRYARNYNGLNLTPLPAIAVP